MIEYRITKYNPAHRDKRGAYLLDEWTAFSDVGKTFNGEKLTLTQYEEVEKAYIEVAMAFYEESQSDACWLECLENAKDDALPCTEEGDLSRDEMRQFMKGILREQFWARIEGVSFFVHFGWDYYMYVGVTNECKKAIDLATKSGLFVEPFLSPFGERESKSCLVSGDQTSKLWEIFYPLKDSISGLDSRALWIEYLPSVDMTHCQMFEGMLHDVFYVAMKKLGLNPVWFQDEKNKRNC